MICTQMNIGHIAIFIACVEHQQVRQTAQHWNPLCKYLLMFFNHIKVAWRNLVKTKGYAAINIGGLSVGLAITLLIGLWLWDELSFNKYHKNYDQIAQIMNRVNFNGQRFATDNLQLPLEKVLRNIYGNQFKHIVLSRYPEDQVLTVGDTKVKQSGRFMQEDAPDLLSTLKHPLLQQLSIFRSIFIGS